MQAVPWVLQEAGGGEERESDGVGVGGVPVISNFDMM